MDKMEQGVTYYRANQGAQVLLNELVEYQKLSETACKLEANLDEFCCAIEDFGLACGIGNYIEDGREIYCCAQSYTPQQLLQESRKTADALEEALYALGATKGKVLSKILEHTNNAAEYEAIRYAVVDVHDLLRTNKLNAEVCYS